MAQVEEIVSRVQRLVARGATAVPAEAEELAELYAHAIEQVNERLGRCVSLIRDGRRPEAIHQAELAPPVLEEAAKLEFPGAESWMQICIDNQLILPPQIDGDAIQEVNEAYPAAQRLDRLLRAHRRQAIGRGRLRKRIRILRQLSQAEPDNPAWGEDLVEFERARHTQIAAAAAAAGRAHDIAVLKDLHSECCVEPWMEKPPAALRQSVEIIYTKAKAQHAKALWSQIDAQLVDAYQRQDETEVRQLIERWDQVVADWGGDPATAETPTSGDARAWLQSLDEARRQQESMDRACLALEDALDAKKPIDRLEKLWARVARHELPVPKTLRSRYMSQIEAKQLEHARRFRIKIAGLVAAVLVVGGTVAGVIYWQMLERDRGQWTTQIEYALERDKLEEASTLVANIEQDHPQLLSSPEIQGLIAQVSERVTQEQTRVDRFEKAITQVQAAGATHPDKEALALAIELAVEDREKLRVEQLQSEIQKAKLMARKQRDADFNTALDALRERYVAAQSRAKADLPKAAEDLGELKASLDALVKQEGVSTAVVGAAKSLREAVNTQLMSATKRLTDTRAAAVELKRIKTIAKSPKKFAQALEDFAQKYPDHAYSVGFRSSVALEPAWRELESWADVAGAWVDLRVDTIQDVNLRLNAVEQWLEASPPTTYRDGVNSYLEYLKRAKYALDPRSDGSRPGSELYSLLNDATMEKLSTLKLKDGRVLYVREDSPPREVTEGKLMVKYVKNRDQAKGNEPLAERLMDASDLKDSGKATLAPQTLFAASARKLVETRSTRWEAIYVKICKQAAASTDMDPILKAEICRELMRLHTLNGWPDHEGINQWLDSVDALPTTPKPDAWMDPYDDTAKTVRPKAEDVIKLLPDAQTLISAESAAHRSLAANLAVRQPVAIIWMNQDGETIVDPLPGALSRGTILEVAVSDGSGGFDLAPIAQITARGEQKPASDLPQLTVGNIVFSRPLD